MIIGVLITHRSKRVIITPIFLKLQQIGQKFVGNESVFCFLLTLILSAVLGSYLKRSWYNGIKQLARKATYSENIQSRFNVMLLISYIEPLYLFSPLCLKPQEHNK